jgi:esterase
MDLFFRKYGSGPPLIILHGLYGSSDNWITIGKAMAGNYTVYLLDQRNHGNSPHSDDHNYDLMKQDLLEFIIQHNLNKTNLIGHSMGGKTVMSFAADYPDRVSSMVVIDIGPKSYLKPGGSGAETIAHENIIRGMLAVNPDELSDREEADAQLAEYIDIRRIRQYLLKNLVREKDGSYRWKVNVRTLEKDIHRLMDGLPLDDLKNHPGIGGFPVLFIRGEKSPYILDEDIPSIQAMFPTANFVTIPEAGHWLHAEQPELLIKNLKYFLD